AALAAVDAEIAPPLVRCDGRGVAPGVATRALDLDDVGAHVCEHHRAVGAGDVLGEVDDGSAGEGRGHGASGAGVCVAVILAGGAAAVNAGTGIHRGGAELAEEGCRRLWPPSA